MPPQKPNNVTNLNQFRKQKTRADKRQKGHENAERFGRSKSEIALEQARAEKAQRDHAAHKKDDT